MYLDDLYNCLAGLDPLWFFSKFCVNWGI